MLIAWVFATLMCGSGALVTIGLTGEPLMAVPFGVLFVATMAVAKIMARHAD